MRFTHSRHDAGPESRMRDRRRADSTRCRHASSEFIRNTIRARFTGYGETDWNRKLLRRERRTRHRQAGAQPVDAVRLESERLGALCPVADGRCAELLHDAVHGHTVRDDGVRSAAATFGRVTPERACNVRAAVARERQYAAGVTAVVMNQSLPLMAQIVNNDNELVAAFMDNRRLHSD